MVEDAVAAAGFCDPAFDLIVQTHDRYYQLLGIPESEGLQRMPINTGVFLIRASDWSVDFLRRAYARTEFVSHGTPWNGIGEQEAMIALLHERPTDRHRIKHVDLLQCPPKFYQPGYLFLHFYGNHARNRIPLSESEALIEAWARAVRLGSRLPRSFARFHWCCIQNKRADSPVHGDDLGRYLYRAEDIAALG